jgi:hypothetical protein
MKPIKSFEEFFPFYLSEHSKRSTKIVHFVGTTIGLIILVIMLATQEWWLFPAGLVIVYGPLFASHFIFEKNRPATFKYPVYSILGDLKMWFGILTGKIKL